MKTKDLKEICSTLTNIIKNDKIRPITDLVEIYAKDGTAHFGCTDNRTTIIATIKEEYDIDNAVISLTSLYNLVKLTSREDISIINKGKYIEFNGNGKYKIPIQLDEMGNELYLSLEMPDNIDYTVYKVKDFKNIFDRNKVGLFTGEGHNEFTLYHIKGNTAVTSDSIVVASTKDINLPQGDIQNFVVEQLSCLKNNEIKFSVVDNNYRISTDNFEIYMINKVYDRFPIEIVEPFLVNPCDNNDLFCNSFHVEKRDIIDSVKRQHIFKSPFDIPSIIFEVLDGDVYLKNVQDTSNEKLDVEYCFKNIKVKISTEVFLNVIKNMNDNIKIYLGNQAISLEDAIGFYIIAVMEE